MAGALRSRLLRLPMRSLFPMTLQNPELLPPAGADCPAPRRLTKTKEEETIIINRSARSTYPEEKSVSRSGATLGRELVLARNSFYTGARGILKIQAHLLKRGRYDELHAMIERHGRQIDNLIKPVKRVRH